jgi:hypothetical protein
VNEEDKRNASLLLCEQLNEISLVKALTIYTAAHGHVLAATTNTASPPPGKAGRF